MTSCRRRAQVRIPEEKLRHIIEILRAIPPEEVERKQRGLEKVWHRWEAGCWRRALGLWAQGAG
jgi:hypothetical protein